MKQAILAATLLASMASSAGCSWLFHKQLPGGSAQYSGNIEPPCSTSQGWPIVDMVFVVSHAVSAIVVLTRGRNETPEAVYYGALAGDALGLILHGASASAGFSWAADCSKAFDRWHETHPTADQLANSPPDEPSPKPPSLANPSNDPRLASSYWCSDRDGACYADRSACLGTCRELDEVWCARYVEQGVGRYGYLCGSSLESCTTLTRTPQHVRGRDNFGACVQLRARGAKPREPAAPLAPAPATPPVPAPAPGEE